MTQLSHPFLRGGGLHPVVPTTNQPTNPTPKTFLLSLLQCRQSLVGGGGSGGGGRGGSRRRRRRRRSRSRRSRREGEKRKSNPSSQGTHLDDRFRRGERGGGEERRKETTPKEGKKIPKLYRNCIIQKEIFPPPLSSSLKETQYGRGVHE